MRNANAQHRNIMIRVGTLQQPPAPHVSHAGIGGWQNRGPEVRTAIGEVQGYQKRKPDFRCGLVQKFS